MMWCVFPLGVVSAVEIIAEMDPPVDRFHISYFCMVALVCVLALLLTSAVFSGVIGFAVAIGVDDLGADVLPGDAEWWEWGWGNTLDEVGSIEADDPPSPQASGADGRLCDGSNPTNSEDLDLIV